MLDWPRCTYGYSWHPRSPMTTCPSVGRLHPGPVSQSIAVSDLKADPLERHDVAADPARAARLTALRDLWTRERASVR